MRRKRNKLERKVRHNLMLNGAAGKNGGGRGANLAQEEIEVVLEEEEGEEEGKKNLSLEEEKRDQGQGAFTL